MRHRSFLGVAVAVAVSLFVFAAPASATHVECGDVISTSGTVTLDSDVVCPANTNFNYGIQITANDVRLDLAGHAIRGAGDRFVGILGGLESGAGTVQRAVILNGRVEGFSTGVNMVAVDSQIRRLSVSAPVIGIVIRGDGSGAGLDNCQGAITNCVVRNVVDMQQSGGPCPPTGVIGIWMIGDGSHAFGNTVNAGEGACARAGMIVVGDRPRINLNGVENCDTGISVSNYTSYAIIWRNTANCHGSGASRGIYAGGANARVRLNTATGNAYGLTIVDDGGAFIAQNDSSGNLNTGMEVSGAGANIVQQNNADNNSVFGINAPDAIDGGGNTASGNDTNCTPNLACAP